MKKIIECLLKQSDAELAQKANEGNNDASEALMHRHTSETKHYLHTLLHSRDMEEEALQNVNLAVVEIFREDRYDERGLFVKLLTTITYRKAMQEINIEHHYVHPEAEDYFDDELLVNDGDEEEQEKEKVEEIIKPLPKRMKMIVRMHVLEHLKYSEIAKRIDKSLGFVTSACSKAEAKLKKRYGGKEYRMEN